MEELRKKRTAVHLSIRRVIQGQRTFAYLFTQCEIVAEKAAALQPAYEELIRQAAQGEVLHNDDTSMRVLSLNKAQAHTADAASERTGVFTSGIVSTTAERNIALFFTGHQHAGENLADVLKRRAAALTAPIQMCDALSRNLPKLPKELEVHGGSLPRAQPPALCGGDTQLSGKVSLRTGKVS